MGPIGTARLLRRRRTRQGMLLILAMIAVAIVVHHPAPVPEHGDGHHHAVAELLLCIALAGAAVMAGAAVARLLTLPGHDRAASENALEIWIASPPRPRARAGPPQRSPVLRT